MIWAVYQQNLDPLQHLDPTGWRLFSTIFAGLPVIVLFWLLVPRRWLAPKAAAAAALTAFLIAWLVFRMPAGMTAMSFVYGAAFGLLPVGWTIFNAMLLYNVTVKTGHFSIVRRSVAGLSCDARIQAILIGFAFGAFLEGAAGGGTPVAICGAIMVGLGFNPFQAAVLCLIANTSPVAYGGLGTPLITLNGVTDIDTQTLSIMAGHQLPFFSLIVPLYMIKCMCTWRQTLEVWPALLVSGGSFAIFQYTFATSRFYPMTDIGGGIFSLVLTAVFLQFWKPRNEFRSEADATGNPSPAPGSQQTPADPHATAAAAMTSGGPTESDSEQPLTFWNVSMAWAPFALMSVLLLLTGLVRQQEEKVPPGKKKEAGHGFVQVLGPLYTNYQIAVPTLFEEVERPAKLQKDRAKPVREGALFNFCWLTAPGSAVFIAALLSMLMFRMRPAAILWVFRRTCFQMKIPIPTIACMLGLSYITRYAGMDATLGIAFAATGMFYPFFAALLGWLGVFLTGTDAGSNALFGSLQKITATEVYNTGVFTELTEAQAQVLICTANSTGGVMGKMIDAQSICVATAATHQLGREADIFKAVIWHSIILASAIGLLTMLQAYIVPFTQMVPSP